MFFSNLSNYNKEILQISIPAIVTNITVPLLGIVDMTIIGHLQYSGFLAAITLGSMIFNIIYWLFGFLRMGTCGITSQALGRRDVSLIIRTMTHAIILSQLISVLIITFRHPIFEMAMSYFGVEEQVFLWTKSYFDICIWGLPAAMALSALTGCFIGMQNTRIPLLISTLQNVSNILISLALVYVFNKQIEGVATGTLMAQYIGLFLGLCLYYRYYFKRPMTKITKHFYFSIGFVRHFFTINRDLFLRTLCMIVVHLFLLRMGTAQGNVILEANALLLQFFTVYSYFMDGFAYAGEAVCGKYAGANKKHHFRDTVRLLFGWGCGMLCIFTLIYWGLGNRLIELLTHHKEVTDMAFYYLNWVCLIPIVSMAAFIWDGIYIGVTATTGMFLSTFLATSMFFIVVYLLFNTYDNHALWLGFITYLGVRSLFQTVYYRLKIRPKFIGF